MKAIIFVRGGVVQEVMSDLPLEYAIIDSDCDEGKRLVDPDGSRFRAEASISETSPDPASVEHYWKQIK